NWNGQMLGLAWTPDGREIVFDVQEPAGPRLWRIPVNGSAPGRGVRLAEATGNAQLPSISTLGAARPIRLAYLTRHAEIRLWLFDLSQTHPDGRLPTPSLFQPSSRIEIGADVSRDGKLVVFRSNRDGANALWISGLDGSNLRKLTQVSAQGAFPDWSPDGQKIAYVSASGHSGVKCLFVINSSGGEPRQLTPQTETAGPPCWSPDGHWIYFGSNRDKTMQIWKITPAGEHLSQITQNGGFEAQEYGGFLYYTDGLGGASGLQASTRLIRLALNGGDEEVVLPQVYNFHWSVTEKGIYYLAPLSGRTMTLRLYHFDTGQSETVGDFPDF